MNRTFNKKIAIWIITLAAIPGILVLIYFLYARLQDSLRYDESYFTPAYLETYHSPGTIARALEGALREGDESLLKELQGLQRDPGNLEPNPNIVLSILIDVDEFGYFHYMFFDFSTYHRSTQHILEVNGRWVSAPDDLYFYWQTGRWWDFFLPPAMIWWVILFLAWLGIELFRYARRIRVGDFNRS